MADNPSIAGRSPVSSKLIAVLAFYSMTPLTSGCGSRITIAMDTSSTLAELPINRMLIFPPCGLSVTGFR
jgi:hypothetical protein